MSERPGVVNLQLVVDMSVENTMTMLYKIGEGYVEQNHYGIALAQVVGLPPLVLRVASTVSQALEARAAAKKESSKAFAIARRRKLVLGLKEALKQAAGGPMDNKALLSWLCRLQEEFVRRMEQIENEAATNDNELNCDKDDLKEHGSSTISSE
jgi:DNA mismatch repair protein MSH4